MAAVKIKSNKALGKGNANKKSWFEGGVLEGSCDYKVPTNLTWEKGKDEGCNPP